MLVVEKRDEAGVAGISVGAGTAASAL